MYSLVARLSSPHASDNHSHRPHHTVLVSHKLMLRAHHNVSQSLSGFVVEADISFLERPLESLTQPLHIGEDHEPSRFGFLTLFFSFLLLLLLPFLFTFLLVSIQDSHTVLRLFLLSPSLPFSCLHL